jgi:hypothetical protein
VNDAKYIGLDVHQATISAAVLDSTGKLVMEAILETKAETIAATWRSPAIWDLANTMRAVLRVPVPGLTASTIGPDGLGVPAP